jgi:hypothetical protein
MGRRFKNGVLAAIRDGKILGIKAGAKPHRTIGIWAVVVDGRVFVRSWDVKSGGWYRTFVEEPHGVIEVNGRTIRVRALRTRGERLKDAIDEAYAAKYTTPGALKYVRGFRHKRRRATTIELVPRQSS